jgi:hypothetical protein
VPCLLHSAFCTLTFSFEKLMPGGGMRQCARSSIEKTRVFDPHMSARWAHRFYARVHFEKSYPGGALLKCLLADLVKTSLFRATLVHDLCIARARGALSDPVKTKSIATFRNRTFVLSLPPRGSHVTRRCEVRRPERPTEPRASISD